MNSYEFHLWLITEQGFTKFIQTQTELLINDFHNNHNKSIKSIIFLTAYYLGREDLFYVFEIRLYCSPSLHLFVNKISNRII